MVLYRRSGCINGQCNSVHVVVSVNQRESTGNSGRVESEKGRDIASIIEKEMI